VPYFSNHLHHTGMKKFDKHIAFGYITGLCQKHKIEIYKYSTTSSGHALIKSRQIKIPRVTNVDRFGVALHEVCHILQGKLRPRYLSEFRCDLYALQHIRALGYETEDWVKRMNWHTISRVAMAHNRGLKTIAPEVKIYFSWVNWGAWHGMKVFVNSCKTNDTGIKITLTKNLTADQITRELYKQGKTLRKSFTDDSTYGSWLVGETGAHNCPSMEFENLSEIIKHFEL
jgi:hypothetical protein